MSDERDREEGSIDVRDKKREMIEWGHQRDERKRGALKGWKVREIDRKKKERWRVD